MKFTQQGFAHILIILLLLAGLVVTVYLVGQQTNLFSKAYMPGNSKYSLSDPISTPTPTPSSFVCTACSADINKDGKVNISDFSLLSGCFNQQAVGQCAVADINGNGTVDTTDFSCIKSQYGKKCITPSPTPAQSFSLVFVTNTTRNGNLGGLAGADNICQTSANNVNIGGTWKAWLSDNNTSATNRLVHSDVPYKLINGTLVANNWSDLIDGSLVNSIKMSESGQILDQYGYTNTVWTGTDVSGNKTSSNCNNWTTTDYPSVGATGITTAVNQDWTLYSGGRYCSTTVSIYCIEQTTRTSIPTPILTPTPTPTLTPTPTPTRIPTPTRTPTPTPTPILTVNPDVVYVTLKKSDAVDGVVSGSGFTITTSAYWLVDYTNQYGTSSDYGFIPVEGTGSKVIKTFIKASLPNSNIGTGFSPYRGTATIYYYKMGRDGGWVPVTTVTYVINLVD